MVLRLLILSIAFLSVRVNAQEKGTIRAVIIGVSKYKNLDSSLQLNYADRDALSFYNFVSQGGFGPIKKENIHILTNEQAQFEQIRRTSLLALFPKDLQPNDHTIIYFAGHGDIQAEFNSAFLLAHDAPTGTDYHLDGAWEIEELEKNIQRASKRGMRVSLFVDACRSGKALSKMGSQRALEALSSNWENIVKVVSCGPEQLSQEDSRWGGGHGVFTYYLLRAFSGLADTDEDRKIRVFELNEYLSKEVRKETQMKQIPRCSGPDTRVVVEVNPGIAFLEEKNTKPMRSPGKRGIMAGPNGGSSEVRLPKKRRKINVPTDHLLLRDSLFSEFYRSLKTGYLTTKDLPESNAYLLDTLPTIRLKPIEMPEGISLINDDQISIIYKEGYEIYDPREGSLIQRGDFSIDAGKLLKIQNNLVLHQPKPRISSVRPFLSLHYKTKPNKKLLITNTNSKLGSQIRIDKLATISHISISPSGRKAVVFGHPPKKKSERLILILDLETLKQTGKIILPEKMEFDNLVLSQDEKEIYGIRVMPGLPVLVFPLENGTNKLAGKEIFRYPRDAKPGLHLSSEIVQDGTALEIVRSTGRDTIWLKTPPTLPVRTPGLSEGLHQIEDSIFFSNGLPGDSNRLYMRKVQTGESAILVNPQLVLFHKMDKIQGMELIIRPKISAEEALAAIPPDNPKKYRAAILLATILAEKGSEPVNQYLRTGSVPIDQAEISQSKSALEKAIALYNDSTFAEGAIRKLKLLNGLILSRSQDRGSQDSARRLFEELGRQYPKAAYPVNALGEWMNANSMPEEASNVLKNSMKLAPKWEVPKQNLWKSYLMVGKTEEARQGLERLIQGNFPTEAGVKLLEIYTQTGDFSRGAFVLKRLNSRYPNSEDVLIGAARFYAAKGVYWRAWKNILKVHQDKPYYPPAMLALMNMPGNAVDKAHFLKKCLERYPDQMEVKAEALLFLKQNPNLAKNFPANLQKDVDSAHWKPGIQDLLKKILRENSTKPMPLPVESNFQDLFDFSQQLKNNGHFNEAAQILKQLSEKNRMELRCRFALAGVLLQQKRVKEAEPVLEQINSILMHKNPVDSGKTDAIPRLEIRIKELTIEHHSGLASTSRSEAISDLLDSLVQLRDQAGLKTPSLYIEAVSGLKPRALKQYFQSRLKDDDLGVYQSNLESHFCRNYLNALLLEANGYRAACRNKMETLSKILPENGLSTKWLAETGYFSLKEQSQLQASYNSIAYNSHGSSTYYIVNEGNCSIVLNPSEKQFHLNIPFAVDRIFTYSKGVKPEVILIVKNQDQDYSLMQFPSLNKIFPGSYLQVSKLSYHPQMQKLMASVLTKNGWGIVTEDSSWLVPDTHQAVDIQKEELTGKYHFEVMQNQKTGIYNQNGKITVPVIYDQLVQDFGTYGQFSLQSGLSCLEYQSGKAMPSKCRIVSKPLSQASAKASFAPTDYSNNYQFGLRVARYYDDLGYANPKNEFVIPAMYKEAGDFVQVNDKILAFVSLNGKEGFIGLDGKPIIPLSYSECGKNFEDHLVHGCHVQVISARRNNMMGIFDEDHRIIIPFEFEEIPFLTRYGKMSYFGGKKGNLFGLFDLSGKVIFPPQFDNISIKGPGVFLVESEGLFFEYNLANDEFKEVTVARD